MKSSSAIPKKAKQAHIIFAGAAHLDRTGWLGENWQLQRSNPGQFSEFPGGTAFNIACICGALGLSATLYSILGNDSAALTIESAADARDISSRFQVHTDSSTATYTSIVQPNGELLVALADMAVYDQFDATDLTSDLSQYKDADYLCVDANLPASQISLIVHSSPSPVVGFTVSAAKAPRLRDCIAQIDLLFTNRAEILALCALPTDTSLNTAVIALRKLGVKRAVVSDGADPVWVMQGQSVSKVPVPTIAAAVDLTGAGDALAGGTLIALAGGVNLLEAVEFGIRTAQLIIQVEGPYRDNLVETLK